MKHIAPQLCIACGDEGTVLCSNCLLSAGDTLPSRCAGCRVASLEYKTCHACRSWLDSYAVYVATDYDGIYEQLLKAYKFDLKRESVKPIAKIMHQAIGALPSDFLICPLPSAPSRVRQRGFDHSKLLAKELGVSLGKRTKSLLGRKSNVRQLGSSRSKRIKQMRQEFFVQNVQSVKGETILLVDDVMTTGASLSAASRALKKAGAKRIYSVVFAQKF